MPLPAANAAEVTVAWDPPPGQVAGYELSYGTSSGNYDYSVDVGNNSSCSISGLEEGTTYYFAAKAYDAANGKSEFSEQLVHTVQSSGTGGGGGGNGTETVIEAEDMGYHANGAQKGAYWNLWSNGSMSTQTDFAETGIYRFEIVAKGRLAHNVGPEMEFLIDGVSRGKVFVNTEVDDIFIFDVEVTAGVHEVSLSFNNDFYDPAQGIDRNLYVDNIVMYLSPGGATPQNNGPSNIIELEAENGSLNYPFEYAWNSSASAEGFIWVPNGAGSHYYSSETSGYAEYDFEVPSAGNYVIWGRVIAAGDPDDSFFIKVDNGGYSLWDIKWSQSWIWDKVNNRDGADPVVYYLEAGSHTLTIKQREDGTKLDKILITDDPAYVPEGLGKAPYEGGKEPDAPPGNIDPADLKLWLEAENGSLNYPFEYAWNSSASSDGFIWAPNGASDGIDWWKSSVESGYAEYDFEVPSDGDYVIWGRVIATGDHHDSFYIKVDNSGYSLWDIKWSQSWIWDKVNNRDGADPVVYYLKAGSHTLTIKQREDGTKLDKILITRDLGFTPE